MLTMCRTEHSLINELLLNAAEVHDLVALIEALDELAPALAVHARHEEGPGGPVEWLEAQGGEPARVARRLRHEHRGFLKMVELLRLEAQGLLTDDLAGERRCNDLARVRQQVLSFVELVHAHERVETRALEQTMSLSSEAEPAPRPRVDW